MINSAMILAGGKGTRFSEYTSEIPKPMIKANGVPLLVHIINHYKKFEIKNFIILAGYKGEKIHEYFHSQAPKSDKEGIIYEYRDKTKIHVLDTGIDSLTSRRIKIGIDYLNEEYFHLTYGDGISDINIEELTNFYFEKNTYVTLSAVRPPARFGSIQIEDNLITKFGEKKQADQGWINGGFFVVNQEIQKFLTNDNIPFEGKPLEKLSTLNQLSAYKHLGFWQPVDTIRELEILEKALIRNKNLV